jgi:hypothetical protein
MFLEARTEPGRDHFYVKRMEGESEESLCNRAEELAKVYVPLSSRDAAGLHSDEPGQGRGSVLSLKARA